jgi:hypothetical protein
VVVGVGEHDESRGVTAFDSRPVGGVSGTLFDSDYERAVSEQERLEREASIGHDRTKQAVDQRRSVRNPSPV